MEKPMRSFISNSDPRPLGKAMLAFGLTLLICIVAGLLGTSRFSGEAWNGKMPTPCTDDPYMVMEAFSDEAYDLYSMYYDIGELMKRAKKADVLILGSSHPFFAFRNKAVHKAANKTGIAFLGLCLGPDWAMDEYLIDHYHLSPSIIIIDENHFFGNIDSGYRDETVQLGYLRAFLKVKESEMTWFLKPILHRIFPRFGLGKIYGSVPVVMYRSVKTGCLDVENFEQNLVPVARHAVGEELLEPYELNNALQFVKDMRERGIQIILTSVPYSTDELNHLDKWVKDPEKRIMISLAEGHYTRVDLTARALGLPLIEVDPDGMFTLDGRHLDEKSGMKFSQLFFDQFLKRPEVQALLKKKR